MVIEAVRLAAINKAIEGLKSQELPESIIKNLESWRDNEMSKPPSRELTDLDLIQLCHVTARADKLDPYDIQFAEYLLDLAKRTGLSIPEIKNRAREYRKKSISLLEVDMASTEWTMNCVIFGAELFKQLSQGQISKEDAIAKIKNLSSSLGIDESAYLLKRLQDLVTK